MKKFTETELLELAIENNTDVETMRKVEARLDMFVSDNPDVVEARHDHPDDIDAWMLGESLPAGHTLSSYVVTEAGHRGAAARQRRFA